ncbi:SIS domain-containing protein [Fodinicola acaciae]|uniref:SIS domain-containing protein n=1 Tax=Fodinicola acaciae TaxID=2681555 RepID=UPI0013D2D6EF|nr:sugar isomerase [Fodinicola acaciae]
MTDANQYLAAEIADQPDAWQRAVDQAKQVRQALPAAGEKVAVVGCGTSFFMAQVYAALREDAGHGLTDAYAASEHRLGRGYDRVVLLSRSGTTTEVLEVADQLRGTRTTAILADTSTPLANLTTDVVALDWADEKSVVQTRFATTAIATFRAHLGEDLTATIADGRKALDAPIDEDLVKADQYTFLGRGATVGLAHEAALKMRESTQSWTESYPAMEYRHGPIAITTTGRVSWMFGTAPEGLAEQVAATGGRFETSELDPLADLVRLHRVALAKANALGLDADNPRHLTRSVILT